MKALKIEPGKAPERIDIDNELEALQDAVGGYIQVLYPDPHRPVGLIATKRASAWASSRTEPCTGAAKPYDVIVGTFLVVGVDEEDFTDLREEDAAYFEKLFHSPEKFKYFAGRLVISKVVSGGA